jgi:hypothetical protein
VSADHKSKMGVWLHFEFIFFATWRFWFDQHDECYIRIALSKVEKLISLKVLTTSD